MANDPKKPNLNPKSVETLPEADAKFKPKEIKSPSDLRGEDAGTGEGAADAGATKYCYFESMKYSEGAKRKDGEDTYICEKGEWKFYRHQ